MSMKFVTEAPFGVHAKLASQIVTFLSRFEEDVVIRMKKKEIDAKSILGLMSLSIQKGGVFELEVTGATPRATLQEIEQFFKDIQIVPFVGPKIEI